MNLTSSGSRLKTLIFQLYKALHGTFTKHTENPKESPKIH